MKKIFAIITVALLMLSLAACGDSAAPSSVASSSVPAASSVASVEASSVVESEVVSDESDGADLSLVVPDPELIFAGADISIIFSGKGTDSYYCRVANFKPEGFDTYVTACKDEKAFTDVSYEGENEGGKTFYAYSEDGHYYLQVMYSTSGEEVDHFIDIICKPAGADSDSSVASE